MPHLFEPFQLGHMPLATRLVMAPLTRNRAGAGQTPTDLMVEYYRQRADPHTGAGLIITEASQVTAMGQGYLDTPGIHTPEQVAGWKRVTDAVHERGGRIVLRYRPGHNPNGSARDIAAIASEHGNVVGMMPHPERATSQLLGTTDGRRLFTSLVMGALEEVAS